MKSFLLGLLALIFAGNAAFAQSPATLRPYSLAIDSGTKTATAVAGAVTLNKAAGLITTEALTTAQNANYTLTLTNNTIGVNDQVYVTVWFGTNTTGQPVLIRATPAAGSAVIVLRNVDAAALNGTLKLGFFTLKP